MEKRIDARGLACPKPVILAKKAAEECQKGDVVIVDVDNEIAATNLRKLAASIHGEYAVKQLTFCPKRETRQQEKQQKIWIFCPARYLRKKKPLWL